MISNSNIRSRAIADILGEREKQIRLGFTEHHDDDHSNGEIASEAMAYAFNDHTISVFGTTQEALDGKTERERLVIACALLLAHLERFDRADRDARQARRNELIMSVAEGEITSDELKALDKVVKKRLKDLKK